MIGISAGTTVLIGQAWGAQNLEKVRSVIGSTLFMTLIGGSIIAVLGWSFAEHILQLLGTDPKVMHLSLPYVRWMLVGSPFFVFLVPLIATNILQNLSGTINTIFVGQMMGVDAIAAVSVFFPILFFLLAFVIGISAGTTVLIGQAWGAQNLEKVRCVIGSTLFMTLKGGYRDWETDRKSTRLNSSHITRSRMPSSA